MAPPNPQLTAGIETIFPKQLCVGATIPYGSPCCADERCATVTLLVASLLMGRCQAWATFPSLTRPCKRTTAVRVIVLFVACLLAHKGSTVVVFNIEQNADVGYIAEAVFNEKVGTPVGKAVL